MSRRWYGRTLAARDLRDIHRVAGRLGRVHRPGAQRGDRALRQFPHGFHPLAHLDRAARHHGVQLLYRARLLRRDHRDLKALPSQHLPGRLSDLAQRSAAAGPAWETGRAPVGQRRSPQPQARYPGTETQKNHDGYDPKPCCAQVPVTVRAASHTLVTPK